MHSFCSVAHQPSSWLDPKTELVQQEYVLKAKQKMELPKKSFCNLYAIKSGNLKTYEIDREGNEIIRGFYFPGEVIGLEGIGPGNYPFSVTALSETLVCEVPYAHFTSLLNTKPNLISNILHLFSQKLNVGTYLNYISAEQRLAAFLIDLFKRLHVCENKMEFALPMSRQDIGNYLGFTGETISRLLSQFKTSKIIEIEHKRIKFLKFDRLQLIAGF